MLKKAYLQKEKYLYVISIIIIFIYQKLDGRAQINWVVFA